MPGPGKNEGRAHPALPGRGGPRLSPASSWSRVQMKHYSETKSVPGLSPGNPSRDAFLQCLLEQGRGEEALPVSRREASQANALPLRWKTKESVPCPGTQICKEE